MESFTITFLPENSTVTADKDTSILSAAVSAGIVLDAVCGGDGVCGRCRVILRSGALSARGRSEGTLSPEERERGIRLACLSFPLSDCVIEVPSASRLRLPVQPLASEESVFSEPDGERIGELKPLVRKFFLELREPSVNENTDDLERLRAGIFGITGNPRLHVPVQEMRLLPVLARDADWKITAAVKDGETAEVLFLEGGDRSRRNFGFAIDIGTTTVSGQLVRLSDGRVLGTRTVYNSQASYGSDVITRIVYAAKEGGREKLARAVSGCINQIVRDLVAAHSIDLNDVTCAVCAGNTTMIHLLLEIDPASIRKEPYVPAVLAPEPVRAQEAGINIHSRGVCACVPGIGSYVGGDVTAGIISCRLHESEDLCCLIDIGTNGEIVVGNKDFLIAASASAGPAFEGSGVNSGMRSSAGAIQRVRLDNATAEVSYETIGGGRPKGICGSGYIDLLAGLLSSKAMDKNGVLSDRWPARYRRAGGMAEFVVAFKSETDNGTDLVISEADIENLKRAKAAIYAGVSILLSRASLDLSSIRKFFIAGGFGTSLDIDNAISIGLLPDLDREKFLFVGNSSLAGARHVLLSSKARAETQAIAKMTANIELSAEPAYMDAYMAALFFPHTDLAKFPSFKKRSKV